MATGTANVRRAEEARPLIRSIAHHLAGDQDVLPVEGHLPAFDGATTWLNSDGLTPDGLRGRVVLVDFWTYTCINWLRTLPYLRAWDAKYRALGLTIVGAHTPEFGFERDIDNVTTRTRGFGIDYPVAVDSDYRVWEAFANHFWPAVYIADAQGRIRYHHFGEGEYAMIETVVQQLLAEAGASGVDPDLVSVEPEGFDLPADWRTLRTPETYVAFGRNGFASPDRAGLDEPHRYPASPGLSLNEWAPVGVWTLAGHAAVLDEAPGTVAIKFQARDVNLVMGPALRASSSRYRVLVDGEPPGDGGGFDVDADGMGTVSEQRLHQLVRQTAPVRERLFGIEFLDPGVEVYCFTFG
jgi:thiol-disulfide isomerase/thioredoxin